MFKFGEKKNSTPVQKAASAPQKYECIANVRI